jgi:hypothetical protein
LSKVIVSDGGDDREQDELKDREDGKSLGEVFGLLHLGYERWVKDLTDPQESDAGRQWRSNVAKFDDLLENSVHAIDKAGIPRYRDAGLDWPKFGVVSAISKQWVVLDAGVDQGKDDGDAHADCRGDTHDGNVVESSGKRDQD